MDNKILDRIQKLIKLSQNNNSPNEAAAAFGQAQKLLTQNRLTIAEVMGQSKESSTKVETKDLNQYSKRATHWKSSLCNRIAQLNQCRMIIFSHPSVSFKVIGAPEDLEIVEYLFNSVVAQIDSLTERAMKNGYGSGKTWSQNYRYGIIDTVIERLKAAKKEAQEEHIKESEAVGHTSCALMVLEKQEVAVQKFVDVTFGKLRSMPSSLRTDYNARSMGRNDGKKVNLSKGLGSKSSSGGYLK